MFHAYTTLYATHNNSDIILPRFSIRCINRRARETDRVPAHRGLPRIFIYFSRASDATHIIITGPDYNRTASLFQEDLEPREDAGPALVVHGLSDPADNPPGKVAR